MSGSPLRSYFAQRGVPAVAIAPGIEAPQRFTGAAAEHAATRQAAGLFDISFMGCMEIAGEDAFACVDYLQTRNLAGLRPGRIAYTLLLREDGSVLNDATVWNLGSGGYALFTGSREDLAHLRRAAAGHAASVNERSSEHAVLALQGPRAWRILGEVAAPERLPDIPYFGFSSVSIRREHCRLARIGYSGETGYELIVPADAAPAVWQLIKAAGEPYGLAECGFEAADTLRIEAGHLLFTRELAAPAFPAELGLERLVDIHGRSFCGSAALRPRREPSKRMAGLLPYTRDCEVTREQLVSATAKPPAQQVDGGVENAAVMTSACYSPTLQEFVAIGFVSPEHRHPGTAVTVDKGIAARVARLPFYDPAKFLPRRTR